VVARGKLVLDADIALGGAADAHGPLHEADRLARLRAFEKDKFGDLRHGQYSSPLTNLTIYGEKTVITTAMKMSIDGISSLTAASPASFSARCVR
jgi:hypothetical protein